jgi:hypothetical protein
MCPRRAPALHRDQFDYCVGEFVDISAVSSCVLAQRGERLVDADAFVDASRWVMLTSGFRAVYTCFMI